MYRTGDTEVFHDSLPGDVGSMSPQFFRQRWLDKGHPTGYPLHFVSWCEHSAIGALDEFASSFASLASSPRASFLWHYFAVLQTGVSHEYIISSHPGTPRRIARS